MTTYTVIPDSDIDPESPLTTGLMTLLRDNPIAISEGASGAPIVKGVAGGSVVLLASKVASNSAQLDFTEFNNTLFDAYLFLLAAIRPATNNVELRLRVSVDGGASYAAGAVYNHFGTRANATPANAAYGASGTTQISLSGLLGLSNAASDALGGQVCLFDPAGSVTKRMGVGVDTVFVDQANVIYSAKGGGAFLTTGTAVNAARFIMGSGNITAGIINMYGFRKA